MPEADTTIPIEDDFDYEAKPRITTKRIVMVAGALVALYAAYLGMNHGPAIDAVNEGGVTYDPISFHMLGGYNPTRWGEVSETESIDDAIPESIKNLDGKPIVIQGYMMPIVTREGRAQEFLLMRSMKSCCYGKPPKLNEIIYVKMEGAGADYQHERLTIVYGEIEVGEKLQGQKLAKTLYRMKGIGVKPAGG
ncbi:MAG: DUF3299 domain-containing protein [Planctomycetota bacterium]|nr:DUF3299 domain-containing protein [Planctomycetota bacterium]MDA1141807.1 DUF3299 domain-containing protein [Planctomycetota bacterium]